MEFPLYQFLVVKWIDFTGQDIAQGARTVSLLCFLVGLVACYRLLRMARFSMGGSCLALVLVVFSPVYLFFSRTVMIESLAWATSAWFLWGVLRFRQNGDWKWLSVVWIAGSIGVLVKATTWAAFCLPWALLFLNDLKNGRYRESQFKPRMLVEAFGIGVALLILGFAWVTYADSVKAQNPMAHFLMSSELTGFNFGSWAMRFGGLEWQTLLGRWHDAVMPWPVMVIGLLIAMWKPASRQFAAIGFGAYLGIQLVFFNLYLLHNYYFYANAVFGALAVGGGIAAWWDQVRFGGKERVVILVVLGAFTIGQFKRYESTLFPIQTAHATGDYGLTQAIRKTTFSDDVVVAHSTDWNSSIAYFTKRRMLMIPDSQMLYHPAKVSENVVMLSDESVPLLLMWGESRDRADWIGERIDQLNLWPQPIFDWENQVTAYARADRFAEMRRSLAENLPPGITIIGTSALLPEDLRDDIAGTELGDQISSVGFMPAFGVLPFGVSIKSITGGKALLVHATSELFFEMPEEAEWVEFEYSVNSSSYAERDFDGMSFHMEVLAPSGELLPLKLDWVSPQNEPEPCRQHLDISSVPSGSVLLFRALPGPQQNNAFDQGWLHKVDFTIEP